MMHLVTIYGVTSGRLWDGRSLDMAVELPVMGLEVCEYGAVGCWSWEVMAPVSEAALSILWSPLMGHVYGYHLWEDHRLMASPVFLQSRWLRSSTFPSVNPIGSWAL
jgi:hypothetical protein